MARVERPPAAASTRPAAGSNDLVPVTKNRKHKVVLESVTQEKQRLRQTITFNAKPPLGYTFIPAGNPELTTALKEQSRKAGAKVYTVTTTPHANVHDLSQQVHRIGYHFSSLIVAEICHQFGIQLSASGHVVGNSYETFLKGYKGRGAPGAEEEGWDQTTLNTKARDAIKDLFPNIPDNDLYQIIKTAFQKGKKRVGTASELPLARRAQLAVVAHIRHCYTAYDRLLRNGGYHDARGVVEKPTLAKLVEWRGDDENGAKVLEDVFREVVVISDDEDSDDDDYDPEAPLKELSVEVLSRNANAVTSQMTPDQRHRISGHGETYTISDDDTPPGVQFIAQRSRRANDQSNNERRGQAHRQVWNAAREQFRAGPQRQQPSVQTPISQPAPVFTSHTGPSSIALLPRPPYDGFERHDVPIIEPRQRPPETIVGKDGTVYTRIVSPPRFLDVNSGNPAHHSATPYDPSRPFLPDNLQRSAPPIPSRINGLQTMQESYAPESEIPLPSIERDDPATTKAQVNRSHYTEPEYRTTPPPYRRPQDTSGFANSIERPPAKKRRYEDTFQTDQFVGAPFQGQSGPDHGNFPEHTVKRFQRIDLRDSPHFEDLRGRDPLRGNTSSHTFYPENAPKGRNPFERVQAPEHPTYPPYDPHFSRLPDQSHGRMILEPTRDGHRSRPQELVPLDSHRPSKALAPAMKLIHDPVEPRSDETRHRVFQDENSYRERDHIYGNHPPRDVVYRTLDHQRDHHPSERIHMSSNDTQVRGKPLPIASGSRYDGVDYGRPLPGPRPIERLDASSKAPLPYHSEPIRDHRENRLNEQYASYQRNDPPTATAYSSDPRPLPEFRTTVPSHDRPRSSRLVRIDASQGGYPPPPRPIFPSQY